MGRFWVLMKETVPEEFSSLVAKANLGSKRAEQEEELKRETTLLDHAIRDDPENPSLYKSKAALLLDNDAYEEAIGLYDKALWLDPRNTEIQRKRKEAIQASKIPDGSAELEYIKGVALLELGIYQEAHAQFEKALSMAGRYKEAAYNAVIISNILQQLAIKLETSSKRRLTPQMIGVSTHYEYAILSAKCYNDSHELPLPTNWELVVTSNDIIDTDGLSYSRDGFYAMMFANHINEEIVIAFQGTDSFKDALTGLHHTWDQIDRQYVCAELFVDKMFEIFINPKYSNYQVVFTGHSLGAAQAEFTAVLYSKRAVTFESPGISLLLERCMVKAGKNVNPVNMLDQYTNLITAYLSRPNMINIARQKVGQMIRIYPCLGTKSPYRGKGAGMVLNVLHYLKRFTDVFVDFSSENQPDTPEKIKVEIYQFMALWETLFQETAHWHSIASICSALELEYTHNIPVKKRRALDWPTIESFSMYYRVTEDCPNTEPDETNLGNINTISLERARYKVVDYDHFLLHERECPPELINFLVSYKESKSPYQAGLTDLDKRVLQEYTINRVVEGEKIRCEFRVTSGLLGYQFRDYCLKRNFMRLLNTPRGLMSM